jgi:hypothetical protein
MLTYKVVTECLLSIQFLVLTMHHCQLVVEYKVGEEHQESK